ncbi:MAG: YitT family protein [Candidatus Gastranaerophilales bacterium]|nr:YitT family protein [Candidatus Gastranaerophilales bacterium]
MQNLIRKFIFLTLGAIIAAFALEGFLVPNRIIDGGVVGISIMCHTLTSKPLGLFIFCLNLPFLFLAYKKFGKRFVLSTLYSVSVLSIFVTVFKTTQVTNDFTLAAVFGGVILGLGVGLILRNEGSLDGTEIVSIRLAKKIGFSVGEIIMFFNVFIFLAAGFLYGWSQAMYSILTYFIAYKVIDIVIEGLNESKSIRVVSDFSNEIGQAIINDLDASVTYIDAEGGFSGAKKRIVFCIISRLELMKLKKIIKDIDPTAFIAIENVHEVEGVRIKKKKI